ncbi:MAG: GNAT family N-acetyltransferase [Acidimicrobiales bacterium]
MPRGPLTPPEQPVTDGEIVLRLRRQDDVPAIAEASRDPETLRRLDDRPMTREQQSGSVGRAQAQWQSGRAAPFVIADAQTDLALGLVNLQFGDDDEVAGLAVSVFPASRGRGVASKALLLAAGWALGELQLRRVFAEAAVDNVASLRAIEKAGFQREGLLRQHCKTAGARHDCVMYSLVPSEVVRGSVDAHQEATAATRADRDAR